MAEDTMLHEAIDAIRRGNKKLAKDLLTRLLKADQHNATYWVWMSAAVETKKERLFALQTALRSDPENAAAKRGLVLLGAMPPDESIEPFPLNRPRLWEEELSREEEEKKTKGFKGFVRNPFVRLAGVLVVVVGIIGLAIFGLTQRKPAARPNTITPGPSPTYTPTPTALNAKPKNTPAFIGPTPLWALLDATYTPTPLYVDTPRAPEASDYGHAVDAAYRDEDWEAMISALEEVAELEPYKADPQYYIGEAYRFMGNNAKAFNAYQKAIDIDPDFGPGYVGKARVLRYINGNANIRPILDDAIAKDPFFAEAYWERADYWLEKKDYEKAHEDLEEARQLAPNSPIVYHHLARVYLAQEEFEDAIEAAETALELDRTRLEAFLLLGQLYEANDQLAKAAEILEIYVLYEEEDVKALTILGGAYYSAGDYDLAIETLDNALKISRFYGKARLYRGLTYLALKDGKNAVYDLNEARIALPDSFEASISLAQAHILEEHYGDCFIQVERSRPLAENEFEEVSIHYWRAICHEGRDDIPAALKDWEAILDLPFSAEASLMRSEAREHLKALYTPTPTSTTGPTPTKTPSPTQTPTP
ncbi:MAG: tetratricopeptide repeat protein [Anaerolineales bacterium]|uniref:Tetratricopeptide repeat protein n=1 Tax=Candidatus Desulfolinea nitratireducens TaxID=2841698 RepID=A0A8J6NIM9_9CHLR|nr:tetratricopeptide repeat protein [Candidatus Desulfolinea nitratireducens]MBL6960753.1 tetratricopeptide repeat protein [Anaerolineales bacterium]